MGLFGKSYDYKFNKEAAQQEKMLQQEQAFTQNMFNQTNEWNLAQWNRENEYNSPAAQMQRMAMAGINPNNAAAAIAGNDSAAGSVQASPVGSPSAPSAPSPTSTDLSSTIMGLADAVGTASNVYRTFRTGIGLDKSQILANEGSAAASYAAGRASDSTVEVNREQIKEIQENVRKKQFDNDWMNSVEWRTALAEYQNRLDQHDINEQTLKNMQQDYDNAVAQGELLKDEHDKNDQIIKNLQKEYDEIVERIKTAVTEQDKNKAIADEARVGAALQAAKKKGQEIQNKQDDNARKFKEKLYNNNIDPDEHNGTVSAAKKVALDNADAQDRNFKNNLAKHRLHWVEDKNGGHAENVNGKIIPVDRYGNPTNGRRSGRRVRYSSNNHTNPQFQRTTAD